MSASEMTAHRHERLLTRSHVAVLFGHVHRNLLLGDFEFIIRATKSASP